MPIRIPSTLMVLTLSAAAVAQVEQPASAPSTPSQSGIGYATVAEALSDLKARSGVQVEVTKPDAWIIVNEPGNVQWSFTPSTHAAHPAVLRRAIKVNGDGNLYIEMSALCQAEKAPCDKLLEEFKALNERIRQSVRARPQQGSQQ